MRLSPHTPPDTPSTDATDIPAASFSRRRAFTLAAGAAAAVAVVPALAGTAAASTATEREPECLADLIGGGA